MIAVECRQSPASTADARGAIESIAAGVGVWLGCDVAVDGLYRREAHAALEPLLAFYLDGTLLRVVPHGGFGRALAEHVALLAAFERVDGRLECRFGERAAEPASTEDALVHPVVTLLRRVLALFESSGEPAVFESRGEPAVSESHGEPAVSESNGDRAVVESRGHQAVAFYGALAFDYDRLGARSQLPDDGRRRLALIVPARVLVTGDAGHRWLDFTFPSLLPIIGTQAVLEPVRVDRNLADQPAGAHARAVALGVERMRRGELCSLVLSQTFRRAVDVDAADAFVRLRRDNPYPAMFFVNAGGGERIFGASPDVQVRADAEWVETAPVCGTFRRGTDPLDDYLQAKALVDSEVDEASLAVCADSDRNDKALVCEAGSVELVSRRRVHFFSTIIHAIDHTRGRRRVGVDGFDIVLAHATPATVTGMPKAAARLAIAEIETEWRGWYAGAAVRIGADGSCEALTMLRFARLVDGVAEVRCGGSLLADSVPAREEEETRLKSETLFRVLAGASPRAPASRFTASRERHVVFHDADDALAASMREALFKAGGRFASSGLHGAVQVAGDGPLGACRAVAARLVGVPALWLNNAALALLESMGARLDVLVPPQFGRLLECTAVPGECLAALDRFQVGVYATHVVQQADLPDGWRALAVGVDGRIVAALSKRGDVALMCRPDSVLSTRHHAGLHMLDAALAAIEHMASPDTLEATDCHARNGS